ncbi:hypothetical protein BX616_011101 [Lobosporangium transversale]|uniref:Chitin-binding type-4 domain-containing protein n=1 Tax=Lobosporangium transversale TaxID=64571 RepID=A0A1Y2G9V7_9FUNG|nr:hypothetical protein BCR41DRAFT_426780 [Lobosporangium transversale]KAF9909663.1 hypothetical protein BX616_011101 [Lobosporangium transversale]ORY96078.1 hypothetical protein BCR41DRAFT_426780 [Lobosporangium transversale]|eukprot:XP_021875505.1 hypothetical protein BCR41DRAFT_426780 [Lobosporangium transversale]
MLARTTLCALVALAMTLLTTVTEAHSWADCVDWRFNDPKNPGWTNKHGKCFGWARKYPVTSRVTFGGLDSASPNRHYQQNPSDFTSCSDGRHGREPGADETRQNPISKAYGGRYGAMATGKAGEEICVRWPAKNHAVPDEDDRGVFINMPSEPTNRDPSQSQLMKMNIAKLPYKNCNHIRGDTDHTPCGGCFKIPEDRKTGTYMVQWRWELNDDEWYTSCWDLRVIGREEEEKEDDGEIKPPVPIPNNGTLSNMTCIFKDLAEDN